MVEASPRDRRMEANLGALAAVQRPVAERLCRPVLDDHLVVSDEGIIEVRHHNRVLLLTLASSERDELVASVEPEEDVLLFGAGDPALVIALLGRGHNVTLWDRDLALIRHVFYETEVQEALLGGSLRILMGVDFLDALDHRDRFTFVAHPVQAALYRTEGLLWETGPPSRLACVCTGGLFVHDVSDALRDQGYGVLPLELLRVSTDEIDHTLTRARPDLVVGINYVKGIEAIAARHQVPVACWEIDPTTDRILPPKDATDRFHLFTYRERQVDAFSAAGFSHVTYLPLASDVNRRRPSTLTPAEQAKYAVPVAHVGSSMDGQARQFETAFLTAYTSWRGGSPEATDEGRRIMAQILDAQAASPCDYKVDKLMGERLGDFMTAMDARRPELDTTNWLAEMAARDKRLAMMARLAPYGAHVWGDPGWQAIAAQGVTYHGRSNHGAELNKIYSGAKIQIDIGRIYQSDIITMRVFDVLACGGFLLAEWNEALEDAFEVGVEIEAWKTPEELDSKVAYYLDHPEEREAIALAGLHAVRDRHRIQQRVARMVEAMVA